MLRLRSWIDGLMTVFRVEANRKAVLHLISFAFDRQRRRKPAHRPTKPPTPSRCAESSGHFETGGRRHCRTRNPFSDSGWFLETTSAETLPIETRDSLRAVQAPARNTKALQRARRAQPDDRC